MLSRVSDDMASPAFGAPKRLISNLWGRNAQVTTRCLELLTDSSTLDQYTHLGLTPVIGREYEGLQVKDLLNGPGRSSGVS